MRPQREGPGRRRERKAEAKGNGTTQRKPTTAETENKSGETLERARETVRRGALMAPKKLLTSAQRRFVCAYVEDTNRKTFKSTGHLVAFPSNPRLTLHTGLSERTMRRHRAHLCKLGAATVLENGVGRGNNVLLRIELDWFRPFAELWEIKNRPRRTGITKQKTGHAEATFTRKPATPRPNATRKPATAMATNPLESLNPLEKRNHPESARAARAGGDDLPISEGKPDASTLNHLAEPDLFDEYVREVHAQITVGWFHHDGVENLDGLLITHWKTLQPEFGGDDVLSAFGVALRKAKRRWEKNTTRGRASRLPHVNELAGWCREAVAMRREDLKRAQAEEARRAEEAKLESIRGEYFAKVAALTGGALDPNQIRNLREQYDYLRNPKRDHFTHQLLRDGFSHEVIMQALDQWTARNKRAPRDFQIEELCKAIVNPRAARMAS